jgi:serine/threonine-protein kinase
MPRLSVNTNESATSVMAVTVESFLKHLAHSGILSADEMLQIQKQVPRDRLQDDAQELGKELARQKKLTVFQANAVYNGKTQGLILGNYVLLDKIGAGGMGMVFKAQHRRMKRLVAVKVLPKAGKKHPEVFLRFQRELEAAAKLTHPNIVAAFDADEHQGTHFLAMEYVDGIDLARQVREHGPLPAEKALDCIIQAARGLEYAHAQGIVHRDIKPANLLLDKNSVVKILDMGLARFQEKAGASQPGDHGGISQMGDFMGTVDFASPEQALDSRMADQASDIYSLGATWYFLVFGQPMYVRDTPMARIMAHREAPIPSLRAKHPEIPPQVDAIFQRMVAKAKDDRYPNATELLRDLGNWQTVTPKSGSQGGADGVPQNVISAIFEE